jgi:hypothetical protein
MSVSGGTGAGGASVSATGDTYFVLNSSGLMQDEQSVLADFRMLELLYGR